MDSGDNELKCVPHLQSNKINSDCFTLNVGQSVSCAAWCPLPVVSTKVDEFKRQFLAIATTSFSKLLENEKCKTNYLQIWDIGMLNSSVTSVTGEIPRLALNIIQKHGDVLDIVWCPFGTSNEALQDEHQHSCLWRLGLLAVASEDGFIRILSIPYPHQLSNSFQSDIVFEVDPLLILKHRHCYVQLCSVISWHCQWPQDRIVAGYTDGFICYWKLTDIALCSQSSSQCRVCAQQAKMIYPNRIYSNYKKNSIVSIQWLNKYMFFTTNTDSCRLWHIHYPGVFSFLFCFLYSSNTEY